MPTLNLDPNPQWFEFRLAPRQHHPPRRKPEPTGPIYNDDLIPRRAPDPIALPHPQGIGIQRMRLQHSGTVEDLPCVVVAPQCPFTDTNLKFMRRAVAYWQPLFSLWLIPLRDGLIKSGVAWAEVALDECDWGNFPLSFHWQHKNAANILETWNAGLRYDYPPVREKVSHRLTASLSTATVRHSRTDYDRELWWEGWARGTDELPDDFVEAVRSAYNDKIKTLRTSAPP